MGNPGADSQRLNWDAVLTAVAEVVIVAPCGYQLGPAYEHAARLMVDRRLPDDTDVWAVDADSYFVRPGPRLVDGAELVGQILHPHLCGSPDPTRALRVASN
jgi:iron complex transport system substrate-binding protein